MSDPQNPREFWLQPSTWTRHETNAFNEGNEIHVIEKCAYDTIAQQLAQAETQRDEFAQKLRDHAGSMHMADELGRIRASLGMVEKTLVEALKRIADQKAYSSMEFGGVITDGCAVDIAVVALSKWRNK